MAQGKVLLMMVLIISDDINHDDAIFDKVMTQGKVLMMIVLIICVENHDDAIFDNVMTQGKSEDGAGKSSGGGEGGAKPSVFHVREIQRNMQKQIQIFQQIQRLHRNKDKGGSKLSFSKSISSTI